jgi:hypothetical protein
MGSTFSAAQDLGPSHGAAKRLDAQIEANSTVERDEGKV